MKTAIAISIAATALLCATSAFAAPKLSPKDRKDTIEGLLLYEYIAWVATSNCPSAMNAFSDQKDVAHGTSLDDIVSAVLKHCRENPKEQGETAILSVLMNIQASE